uniref:2Fe-2S iron-sulfur cluster-binding protein n=1 Tax=Flavobacterium sp. TaxID=239 RepID=UPI00404B151B
MSTFYKLSIQEIKRETPSAVSIVFQVPSELRSFYQFEAGQYVTLKLKLDGQEIRRAYSICSSPASGELRIAIKAVKNGFFSKFANEELKVGHVIEVGIPEGKFTLEPHPEKQRNLIAFAAGSGITPILSIVNTVLKEEPKSSFVLVYGNKTPEETMFYNQLNELQKTHLGRFFVHYVFSQTKVDGEQFGRIEKPIVNFFLKNKHKEISFSKYFICGPETMINAVTDTLKEQNVVEKDIKFELFTTSDQEKTIDKMAGHAQITIILDSEETTFEMSEKQTILEAALKHGLDAPYSCQGGICSSCLGRITEGSAEMKKNSILTDGEIAEGLILTCQAHATSASLKLDYDDV